MDVTHAEPAHGTRYQEIYDLPVRFGAARNGLKINPEWLTQELEDANAYVFGLFADKADALMAALEAEETLRAQVESLLLPRLHRGNITAESIASSLGMSRQTMYRRLRDEDVSLQKPLTLFVTGLRQITSARERSRSTRPPILSGSPNHRLLYGRSSAGPA